MEMILFGFLVLTKNLKFSQILIVELQQKKSFLIFDYLFTVKIYSVDQIYLIIKCMLTIIKSIMLLFTLFM